MPGFEYLSASNFDRPIEVVFTVPGLKKLTLIYRRSIICLTPIPCQSPKHFDFNVLNYTLI
jgi:hypothetical protein